MSTTFAYTTPHPHLLTPEEIENPFLVIEDLFAYDDLPNIRDTLWEFCKAGMTSEYAQTLK